MLAAILAVMTGWTSAAQAAVAPVPGVPMIRGGAAVAEAPPQFDYTATVPLSAEDLKGDRFMETSRNMFEAFIAHPQVNLGWLAAGVARRRFEAILPLNMEFARGHAEDGISLAFKELEAGGKKRFGIATTFQYNGRTVTAYRYVQGNGAASSIFIDGKEAKDTEGNPIQFFSKDAETFGEFVTWFEATLGKPKAKDESSPEAPPEPAPEE
ncbi:MAG: hypothetical protein HYZ75_08575 [Elusimicrobia bacterium]|nr:hypothetical protein [Elusimicrobiota bacterium]